MDTGVLLATLPWKLAAGGGEQEVIMYRDVRSGFWHRVSALYFRSVVGQTARAMAREGVEKGARIALLTDNCPECLYISFAAYRIGAVCVPLFGGAGVSAVADMLRMSRPRILFAGTATQYRIALEACRLTGAVIRIVTLESGISRLSGDLSTVSLSAFLSGCSDDIPASVGPERDDTADIIFTSGTTGSPKGAVITHAMYEAALGIGRKAAAVGRGWRVLEYLPYSHVFERTWAFFCLSQGATLVINRYPSRLLRAMQDIRPDAMCCVPRFWEKYMEEVDRYIRQAPEETGDMIRRAVRTGDSYNNGYRYACRRAPDTLMSEYRRADREVLSRIRQYAGLEKAKIMPTAGAVVPAALVRRVRALGLPLFIGYGMTETTATVSCDDLSRPCTPGSVGRVVSGVEVSFAENGEILVKGNTVISHYLDREVESPLHTGDAGYISPAGELYITGRIKDLLKTSTGEYVAPEYIESRIEASPEVDRCVVVAEGRKFVSALIFPSAALLSEAAEAGDAAAGDRQALLCSPYLRRRIAAAIARGQDGDSRHTAVKRFMAVDGQLTVENGCLTPMLKLRRSEIERRYREEISIMYDNRKYELYDNI